MKLLFVHDHKFHFSDNKQFYSTGGLPASVWLRYLEVFDSVDVVGRRGSLIKEDNHGLVLSSNNNVKFFLQDSSDSLINRFIERKNHSAQLSQLINDSDGIVIRLPSELGFIALDLAKKANKNFAIEVVDCPWDGLWNHGSFIRKLYAPILFLRMRFAVKKSKFSLYVTKGFLQKRYPSNASSVQVDCSNVEISMSTEKPLSNRLVELSQTKKKVTYGLIGTMNGKLKGIQTVLQALSHLANIEHYEFRILSTGKSPYYTAMVKDLGLENNVYFDGPLPSGKPVLDWLDNIDIYLHPSYKEGLPRALIEAMSRGCPCIASNIAGIPELLDSDFLITPGDYKDLAKKMKLLNEDLNLKREAAITNFSRVKEYDSLYLDAKRKEFFENYRNSLI